ncbi:hypothetical protein [Pendulispora albinea]|uniref:Uncharacterized protein n=1 Tax=Pendulispora albinea TaxID=2741071 RepID=A0ABZ2LJE9_9BACT
MAKSAKRKGATTTFSVSVDSETKKILRKLADDAYGGNLSALVTEVARDAARRQAAAELLRMNGLEPMGFAETLAFEKEIEAELASPSKRKRKVA